MYFIELQFYFCKYISLFKSFIIWNTVDMGSCILIKFFILCMHKTNQTILHIVSRPYIKRFVWFKLYASDFRFPLRFVDTEFIKVVHTEYSAFKNLIKMSEKKGAAAIIIGLISKKASQGKRDKKSLGESLD